MASRASCEKLRQINLVGALDFSYCKWNIKLADRKYIKFNNLYIKHFRIIYN